MTAKKLRPYQESALGEIRSAFLSGHKRVICQGPVAFGKTILSAQIIRMALSRGSRVIFTAPAISLIDQTVSAFEGQGITGIGVMQANHPRTDPSAKVQVASVQTLARRNIPSASLIIVDECHIDYQVIRDLMDERRDVYFIGLSATPWSRGLGLRWEKLITPITTAELIDQGYLSKFRVYAPDAPNLSGVKTIAGEYSEKEVAEIMGDNKLIGSAVDNWLESGENRPTLCFAVNCAHAEELAKEFAAKGVVAGYCDAHTDRVEMARLERRFRSGEIRVVCSVRKITTGVDWPVSCIIDNAPTKSEMLHCLDSKTEILTSTGWKGIGEIKEGDCVASCRGVDTSDGCWAIVDGVVRRRMNHNEKWVLYESPHSDFRVTDSHNMLFKGAGAGKEKPFIRMTALKMASYRSGGKYPTAIKIPQIGVPLNEDELYIIGMLMSDGSWTRSQGYIYQSERHMCIIERIESTLKRLGISFRKSPIAAPKRGSDVKQRHRRWRYNLPLNKPREKVGIGRFAPHPDSVKYNGYRGIGYLMPYLDKDLSLMLMAMSREQFLFLFRGIFDGDGFKKVAADYTPRTKDIVTVRKDLADRLQMLGAIHGLTVNVRQYQPEGRKLQYLISFRDKMWRHCGGHQRTNNFQISDSTDEEVWCVSTPTGNIVTRRNGKVTVMGNCQKIGRGLRVNPGTEDLIIFDHAGNTLRLGLITEIHHEFLDKTKPGEKREKPELRKSKPKPCSKCNVLFSGLECPSCGHIRKRVSGLEYGEGELSEVAANSEVRKITREEKQAFWSMALFVDEKRGKGGKLALALFKGKYDEWPNGLHGTPRPPDNAFKNYETYRRIKFAKSKKRKTT